MCLSLVVAAGVYSLSLFLCVSAVVVCRGCSLLLLVVVVGWLALLLFVAGVACWLCCCYGRLSVSLL